MSDADLDLILKRSKDKQNSSLLPDELSYLITAFLPTQPADHRSKAYLVLSAFCQGARASASPDNQHSGSATNALVNALSPSIVSRLGDVEEVAVLAGISFLVALFRVDHESACSIFLADGVAESVADSVDLFSSTDLALEVGHLLGQASSHKACRAVISAQSLEWLEAKSRQTIYPSLRAAAALALVKLSRGRASDDSNVSGLDHRESDTDSLTLLKGIIVDTDDQSTLTDAVEGLAYISVDPLVKEDLSRDTVFLKRLFSIAPRRTRTSTVASTNINSTLLYGVVTIISNICMYRPKLSEEQAQIDKLRRMAKAGKQAASDSRNTELEDDEHCRKRTRRLVESEVIEVLVSAVSASDSRGVRLSAGKAFLSIIEDKQNRGMVLQGGGAKSLRLIIGQSLSSLSTDSSKSSESQPKSLDVEELVAIQALAKLAITSSPLHVFGPDQGLMFDAMRPFTLMLLHYSSTLLQRFEALMALTNLSSASPEAASRIAETDTLMNKVELFLLEDHPLIRRAAMELICNLVTGSDDVFERYCGGGQVGSSKILVVLALCDVEDMQTRLAASGALATLTSDSTACRSLLDIQRERHRVFSIFTQLIDPSVSPSTDETEDVSTEIHPGLVHRGVVCACNFLISLQDPEVRRDMLVEVVNVGLDKALANVAQTNANNESIFKPTMEALKWIGESAAVHEES
jgi:Myosin-binding striated muscle assembly central